jgi:hypothetical protein
LGGYKDNFCRFRWLGDKGGNWQVICYGADGQAITQTPLWEVLMVDGSGIIVGYLPAAGLGPSERPISIITLIIYFL